MIYYPLSTLLLAGIREVLLISTPQDLPAFERALGDGSDYGISIQYAEQAKPEGIAQAFIIGADFIGNDSVALALGDNIFYGHGLTEQFSQAAKNNEGATIFGYQVHDPERYGVAAFDDQGNVTDILEKPADPPSNYAIVGLYFYDSKVVEISQNLKPSARGELEITDVNREYLKEGRLKLSKLGRGTAWLDTGTHEALLQASVFVQAVEERQGLMVCCPEEISYRQGFIDQAHLQRRGEYLAKSGYGQYLLRLAAE